MSETTRSIKTRLPATLLSGAFCAALLALAGAAYAETSTYLYSVWYGDKRIGEHEYVISRSGDGLSVRSEASMEVRVLFVPVYRYRHLAEEVWQDGCLTALSAETDDNGRHYALQATATPGAVRLQQTAPALDEREVAPVACPASFAYWDLDLLRQEQLLNAQTGEIAPATLIPEGNESLDGVAARRYLLEAEGLTPIRLWYRESDDQWLRLETSREGATISYRLERLESSAQLAQNASRG